MEDLSPFPEQFSIFDSLCWYNEGMTDNTMEVWQTIQWQNLIVPEIISIKHWPLNIDKSLKIPKGNQNLYIEKNIQQNGQNKKNL
jgi:hypothetical protein